MADSVELSGLPPVEDLIPPFSEKYYYVSFFYTKRKTDEGYGNIVTKVSVDAKNTEAELVPSVVSRLVKRDYALNSCTVLNWIELTATQYALEIEARQIP